MNQIKLQKLKVLQAKLAALETPVEDISQFFINEELANISERLKANPTIKSLQKFNADLQQLQTEVAKLKVDFNIAAIQTSIRQIQKELKQADLELMTEFETRLRALPKTPDLTEEVAKLRTEFETKIAIPVEDLKPDLENIKEQLQDLVLAQEEEDRLDKEELQKELFKLRQEINKRLSNLGGGQASRQILVAGNESKKYKDINLKAGSNVTLTLVDNNTTKRSEITISATGGSGSGIVRSIQSISASQTADSSSTTDYVYLCSGTMTLTLPDASTNSNLYTVKNVGSGTITIDTTSSQTIDGALTLVMPVQFTSVDLISDTLNWSIT